MTARHPQRHLHRIRLGAATFAVALLAGACGDSDSGKVSRPAETGTSAGAAQVEEPESESGANALNITLLYQPGDDVSGVCAEAAAVLNERYPVSGGWVVSGGAMDGYSECALTGDGPFSNVLVAIGGPAFDLPSESISVAGYRAYESEFSSNHQISLTFDDSRTFFVAISIFNLADRNVLVDVAERLLPLFVT